MITIRAKHEGFRRCGIAHSKQPVDYADDHFTTAELKTLKAEPLLTVTTAEEKQEQATMEQILAAITSLDKELPGLWTKTSGPKLEAIEAALGCPVTTKQRDEAWAAFQKGAE